MINFWKYSAINAQGQEVSGILNLNKEAAKTYILSKQLEIIDIRPDFQALILRWFKVTKLSTKILKELFEDLSNMQQTGMQLNQMITSLKESTSDKTLVQVLTMMDEAITKGESLSQAFMQAKVFPWIVVMTIKCGEESGDIEQSYKLLTHYFKRQDEVINRLKHAFTYPLIVLIVLVGIMMHVGIYVIPKLKELLPDVITLKGLTGSVIILSLFIQKYYVFILIAPLALLFIIIFLCKTNKNIHAYLIYKIPLMGDINKETDLAFYFLNLSIMLRNGIPLIKCINDLNAFNPSVVSRHFYQCRDYLFGGMPLWEALKMNALFSSVVVFTVRRGEEMAKLPEYCLNLSEYFNRRVFKRIDVLVLLIQPALLAVGGIFILIIAFAFLIPLYGSLTQFAGG